jgi:glycosyltransferase involved in cell wall biosynthesis
MGAPAARFSDFARYWIEAGHEVSVITSFPNFPNGIIPAEYQGKLYQKEKYNGINVYRGYIYASPKLNFLSKVLGYISFVMSSILIIFFARLDYDVVISTSPPPMVGLPGILASKLRRKPLVFDVRDIWPEGIVQSGRLKNRLLIKLLESIERFIYRSSKLITVVTEGKKARLTERGIPAEKIAVISNGVDIDLFDQMTQDDLPDDLDHLGKKFTCLTYAGVFNPSQGLDIILDCAAILKEKAPEYSSKLAFILIGDGSLRKHLEKRKEDEKLENVHFMGIRPRPVVFSMLKKSFANIVTLRKRGDLHTVPSKIYEALASGRPTLLSAAGEPVNIINKALGGLTSGSGDAEILTQNIITYLLNPELADIHGKNGRKYCQKFYDRRNIADTFLKKLTDTIP